MSDPEDPGGSAAVTVTDEQAIPVDQPTMVGAATRALLLLGVPDEAQLSITLVDAAAIAELKQKAFGKRAATDVLSFPMDDLDDPMPGPLVIGDVVICPEVALRQARALGRSFDDEMLELLVHGILHVLGRDHDDVTSERAMAAEQRTIVRALTTEAVA